MAAKHAATPIDPGLQQIADLEHNIVLGKEQLWQWNGVSDEEIGRLRPDVVALAKAVCDQLRAEYAVRSARSPQP